MNQWILAYSCSALMGNYYFNPNRKMKNGHCSLIVRKVAYEHSGQWSCAGRLAGRNVEYSDDFRVHVFDNGPSLAAIIGMPFAALFILGGVGAAAFLTYRKKYRSVARSSVSSQSPIQLESESF